ncbi:hypothetical protein HK097_002250 [Rhizophlyctis rosea]|uniref:Uncharacterized protein n=1 Tax=Rhizophlyctis rosea TaxID=64517 RepID=A0AAD5SGN6_9FUNG|nr:hypothetical protein HK097_002250 [Rhizophlyctis rosea]
MGRKEEGVGGSQHVVDAEVGERREGRAPGKPRRAAKFTQKSMLDFVSKGVGGADMKGKQSTLDLPSSQQQRQDKSILQMNGTKRSRVNGGITATGRKKEDGEAEVMELDTESDKSGPVGKVACQTTSRAERESHRDVRERGSFGGGRASVVFKRNTGGQSVGGPVGPERATRMVTQTSIPLESRGNGQQKRAQSGSIGQTSSRKSAAASSEDDDDFVAMTPREERPQRPTRTKSAKNWEYNPKRRRPAPQMSEELPQSPSQTPDEDNPLFAHFEDVHWKRRKISKLLPAMIDGGEVIKGLLEGNSIRQVDLEKLTTGKRYGRDELYNAAHLRNGKGLDEAAWEQLRQRNGQVAEIRGRRIEPLGPKRPFVKLKETLEMIDRGPMTFCRGLTSLVLQIIKNRQVDNYQKVLSYKRGSGHTTCLAFSSGLEYLASGHVADTSATYTEPGNVVLCDLEGKGWGDKRKDRIRLLHEYKLVASGDEDALEDDDEVEEDEEVGAHWYLDAQGHRT